MARLPAVSPARVTLRVVPGSSGDSLSRDQGGFRLRLAAPAVEGKANKRLIAVLGKMLHVPQSSLKLERGQTARTKLIAVEGMNQEELDRRLLELAE
ncbi:MAG: DUF167 domain-containing protein [Chloroflexota bacterium]|nr:DUF167 domain-containing protein [Chloroflexota bacterium]